MDRLYRLYTKSQCDCPDNNCIFPLHEPIIQENNFLFQNDNEEDNIITQTIIKEGSKLKCINIKYRGTANKKLKIFGEEFEFLLLTCNGDLYQCLNQQWCLENIEDKFYFLDQDNCFIYHFV